VVSVERVVSDTDGDVVIIVVVVVADSAAVGVFVVVCSSVTVAGGIVTVVVEDVVISTVHNVICGRYNTGNMIVIMAMKQTFKTAHRKNAIQLLNSIN